MLSSWTYVFSRDLQGKFYYLPVGVFQGQDSYSVAITSSHFRVPSLVSCNSLPSSIDQLSPHHPCAFTFQIPPPSLLFFILFFLQIIINHRIELLT